MRTSIDGVVADWDAVNHLPGFETIDLPADGIEPGLTKPISQYASWSFNRLCEHAQQSVTLADGTSVFASASYDKYLRCLTPDLAVWLDNVWQPDSPAFSIPWPDYGLPDLSLSHFLYVANLALAEARRGLMVEVGCIGGHGRTGTFLACLDVLASADPDAARSIAYVRSAYCHKAVETPDQAWFVGIVAARVTGAPIPPRPRPKRSRVRKAKTVKAAAPVATAAKPAPASKPVTSRGKTRTKPAKP